MTDLFSISDEEYARIGELIFGHYHLTQASSPNAIAQVVQDVSENLRKVAKDIGVRYPELIAFMERLLK
ncbi:MAG TPA: hypothetical protein VHD31_00670 [Candidatus Paceibacterota bacterium]|nr:hypothetical protein [Candidatus Paceibacterota bacterium]